MQTRLRQPLPPGPLDIIGDVHGELGALKRLLSKLGVDWINMSVERPLVFVGDLIDRGPDSPGVVALVRSLRDAGLAWCVAGNHELNLLAHELKQGNGWARDQMPERFRLPFEGRMIEGIFDSVAASNEQRTEILEFISDLPVVLEREDLRVVHACWWSDAVAALPEYGEISELSERIQRQIDGELTSQGWIEKREKELSACARLKDPDAPPQTPPHAHVHVTERRQRLNPIRALTSGLERPLMEHEQADFKGGKWRYLRRLAWWEHYEQNPAVVVGHYWRSRSAVQDDNWATERPTDWAGPRGNVFCLDYSVGLRFAERSVGRSEFRGGLAAMRWPERLLVFDDREGFIETTRWAGC
ncbi:MAG: metallophosphoesterase [Myxococcales bacterium]|nr:metallophosphoesterase [Myxococcales bacterium]